jgi:RNA polymerase sigma-70 factor (ECF subfamily)
MNTLDDKEGMEAMEERFDAFYQQHLPLVFAAALARCQSRTLAEDLAQETLLRAWRHFDILRQRDVNAQRAWLLRALRHRAIESWRQQRPECPESLECAADLAFADDGTSLALRLDVLTALGQLTPDDREIVVLRYFLDLNSSDIAAVVGVPDGTVRRRLAQCRTRLADSLKDWRDG